MWKKTGKRKISRLRPLPPRTSGSGRLFLLVAFWILGFSAIIGKLYLVQWLQHDQYRAIAKSHLESRRELPAQRGTIVDRNGEQLAVDLMHYSVAVRPKLVADRQKTARQIGGILHVSQNDILKKIQPGKSFVYIKHRLDAATVESLKALKVPGIIIEKKFNRYYPYGETGAQLIGYCDYDNVPKGGLELEYNEYLKGQPGWTIFLRDALGNQFPDVDYPASEPLNGLKIETTLDVVYQSILEEELQQAVKRHQGASGSAVLLNPRTGEVLGMANFPTFDPNKYNRYPIDHYRNRAVTDIYEPGSTFKMVSLALCLEQLNLDLDHELVFCENGRYRLLNKEIKDYENFGYLTARQVFEKSSNIGVIKLASRFQVPLFYRYARDFGFGAATAIDLPAESAGILHKPGDYSRSSVYYLSIGYEVGVTPLQTVSAYAAVANDGVLMQPYVVRRVVAENGKVYKENHPQVIRQVISPATAERMKEILTGVVEHGTGRAARIEGLMIGGKTGTAQKIDHQTNSYTSESHVASFVGIFPMESPRFVLLVVINNPHIGYYGSQVAAPAFRNIAQRIAGLPARDRKKVADSPVKTELAQIDLSLNREFIPSLEGMDFKKAVQLLNKRDLDYHIVGDGSLVYRQEPSAYSPIGNHQKVTLYTDKKDLPENIIMPRLTGLSLKEALQVISQWDVVPEVEGSGTVVQQLPLAGRRLPEQAKIKLVCKPE